MRAGVFFLIFLLVPVMGWAGNGMPDHLAKKNSIALKPGYHTYPDSDLFDFWGIDEDDFSDFMFEIAYERKINPYIGLEIAGGYFSSDERYRNVFYGNDLANLDIDNFYLSPTLKVYLPASDYFYLYAGAGPDLFYTELDFDYSAIGGSYSKDNDEVTFGGHVMGGMEFYLFNYLQQKRYKTPVGLFVEYRYSWVDVD
ncbi:MAG: outer membrane beta-barrel protein, partial [Desulfovermiculus sp.]